MISEELLKENHEICLELLDKFMEVCEKYKISYYLTEGSALGAIRHKGFIPWDINVDVHLDIEGFKKLDEAMKKEDLGDIIWCRPPYRICSLLKRKDSSSIKTDPNIDISIMGFIPNNAIGRWFFTNFAFINIKMFKLKNTNVNRKFPYNFLKVFSSIFPDSFYFNNLKLLQKLSPKKEREYMSALTPSFYGASELIKTSWIGDSPTYVDFEGRKVPTFQDSHSYLTHRYGDYMKPKVWESKGEYDGCFYDRK